MEKLIKRYAIILSGGIGERFGANKPKQYIMVYNKPVIEYCLDTFFSNELTDEIVIVIANEWHDFLQKILSKYNSTKRYYFAPAGATRQLSIYNALMVISNNEITENDIVLIHDAARPLVTTDLIDNCYKQCLTSDCVMPVLPIKDTVYYSNEGTKIDRLMNRTNLWLGQAPEAFKLRKYINAFSKISHSDLSHITGSSELAFKAGLECKFIAGDVNNFKITTKEDLVMFERIIKEEI